jgi:CRP-like cAMP-binding protein
LRKYCYFASLSDAALEEVAGKLEVADFAAGEEIVHQDSEGDSFYFLSEGEVEVRKRTHLGQTAVLSTLSGTDVFGEMALLTGSPRAASVTARTDVTVFRLPKNDFERVVLMDSCATRMMERREQGYEEFDKVKMQEPFAGLDPGQMSVLLHRLRERTYGPEEEIVTQGQKGEEYFIIKSGSVAVLKTTLSDKPEIAAVLGQDEAFGEESLLTDSVRSATIRTLEETVVFTLSRSDFDSILKSSYLEETDAEEVELEGKENSTLLDVRTKWEFQEEYIPGAVSFPLDELRARYDELDPDREYYTYCLVGARSAVASFLLGMHGIRSRSIRGGIMNWKGPIIHNEHAGVHDPGKPT